MSGKLILIIDGEDSVREVLSACLYYLGGWKVLSAASFQEGIDALRTEHPDAIVLDMPNSKFDERFLQRLRNHPLSQSIPVLLISAKASWFSPQQLQELGIAGAIAKPFNPITLVGQIAAILGWSIERCSEK